MRRRDHLDLMGAQSELHELVQVVDAAGLEDHQPDHEVGPKLHRRQAQPRGFDDESSTDAWGMSMIDYTLAHLRLPLRSGNEPGPVLELVEC